MSQPYYPEQERSFAEDKCFLCGTQLTSDNRSDEHVIPKWVQHEFALWNQNLTLLNQTPIPYRQLTIPCCAPCNNEHLNRIEVAVSTAWREGFDSFASLNRDVLFLWLAKIVYGLLVRELFLPARILRAELWVHKNSTLMGWVDMVVSLSWFKSAINSGAYYSRIY